jgi:hypothetical protein
LGAVCRSAGAGKMLDLKHDTRVDDRNRREEILRWRLRPSGELTVLAMYSRALAGERMMVGIGLREANEVGEYQDTGTLMVINAIYGEYEGANASARDRANVCRCRGC